MGIAAAEREAGSKPASQGSSTAGRELMDSGVFGSSEPFISALRTPRKALRGESWTASWASATGRISA